MQRKNSKVLIDQEVLFYRLLAKRLQQEIKRQQADIDNKAVAKKIAAHAELLTDSITDLEVSQTGLVSFEARLGKEFISFLNAIPWAVTITLIFTSLFKALHAALFSDQHFIIRLLKATAAIAGLTMSILAVVFIPLELPLFLAALTLDTVQHFIGCLHTLKNYFIGTWKKERQQLAEKKTALYQQLESDPVLFEKFIHAHKKNPDNVPDPALHHCLKQYQAVIQLELRHYHRKIQLAKRLQTLLLSSLSIVGASLLLTPAAPIGAVLLVGVGLYGIFDKLTGFSKKLFATLCKSKMTSVTVIKDNVTSKRKRYAHQATNNYSNDVASNHLESTAIAKKALTPTLSDDLDEAATALLIKESSLHLRPSAVTSLFAAKQPTDLQRLSAEEQAEGEKTNPILHR